jgi:hypothetical protein
LCIHARKRLPGGARTCRSAGAGCRVRGGGRERTQRAAWWRRGPRARAGWWGTTSAPVSSDGSEVEDLAGPAERAAFTMPRRRSAMARWCHSHCERKRCRGGHGAASAARGVAAGATGPAPPTSRAAGAYSADRVAVALRGTGSTGTQARGLRASLLPELRVLQERMPGGRIDAAPTEQHQEQGARRFRRPARARARPRPAS